MDLMSRAGRREDKKKAFSNRSPFGTSVFAAQSGHFLQKRSRSVVFAMTRSRFRNCSLESLGRRCAQPCPFLSGRAISSFVRDTPALSPRLLTPFRGCFWLRFALLCREGALALVLAKGLRLCLRDGYHASVRTCGTKRETEVR